MPPSPQPDNIPVTVPPPAPVASLAHLSEENLRQLAVAQIGVRKIRRAISIANFDGWTIGAFAALTLLFGLTDPSSLLMGAGMGAIAFIELRGVHRLRRLDPRAPRTLGFNQLALATLLIVYSSWRLFALSRGGSLYADQDPQIAEMLQPVESLTRMISTTVYITLIAIAIFAQGGLALYYFTRGKHIQAYVTQTPGWIIAMQQAGVSL